tara:strand:+ start:41 stop:499 length:459 start_codon:yes stop_codon:yes gene_type:complete
MLPSVTGLSLSALRSVVPIGAGVKGQHSNNTAKLHVHTGDGAEYQFDIEVRQEKGLTGTYVNTERNDSLTVLKRKDLKRIFLVGVDKYQIFQIDDSEQLRKLVDFSADFSADSDPVTMETIYGAKVEFAPFTKMYGPQGFKIEVTSGRGHTL